MSDEPLDPDPEPDDDPESEPAPEPAAKPDPKAVTTRTKDYRGVALVNATPGTSNATDYLGRVTVTGNVDYMGRALVA